MADTSIESFSQNYCAEDCRVLLNQLLLASMSSEALNGDAEQRSNLCSFILELQVVLPIIVQR